MRKSQYQEAGNPKPHQFVISLLLTRKQVAQRWACCEHTVARRKDLHPVRLGRRLLRYSLAEIEQIEASAK